MELGLDWGEYQRLDNATIVDFLSSIAAAMSEANILSQKDSEDLRLSIRNLQKGGGWDQQPALTSFAAGHSEFLQLLLTRYGATNLNLNILRLTLRPHLTITHKILSELGEDLLQKAKLYFNQPFYVFVGGQCERKALFSSVLVELAACIEEATLFVAGALDATYVMLPSDYMETKPEDRVLDERISQYLGFKSVAQDQIPHFSENKLRRQIAHALARLADTLTEVLEQYRYNFRQKSTARLEITCEWLKAEGIRLSNLTLPRSGDLEAWELRRHNVNSTIIQVNKSLGKFAADFTELLSHSHQVTAEAAKEYPNSAQRQLALDLMIKGAPASVAQKAAHALIQYCVTLGVAPQAVIPAELTKIHPALSTQSLQILQEIAIDKSMSAKAAIEKEKVLQKCSELSAAFKAGLTRYATLGALLFTIMTGCGVKTAPKSDIEDPRPSIPFHPEAPNQIGTIDPETSAVKPEKPAATKEKPARE